MDPQMQKRVISVLSTAIAAGLSRAISSRLIHIPEQPGIMDDLKEASVNAGVTVVATFMASVIVRRSLGRG